VIEAPWLNNKENSEKSSNLGEDALK